MARKFQIKTLRANTRRKNFVGGKRLGGFFEDVGDFLTDANKYAQFGEILFEDGNKIPAGYYPQQYPNQYPQQYPNQYPNQNPGFINAGLNTNTILLIGAALLGATLIMKRK